MKRMTIACATAKHERCPGQSAHLSACACVCHHVTHSVPEPTPCTACAYGRCQQCFGCTWDRDADDYTDCPCAGAGHG